MQYWCILGNGTDTHVIACTHTYMHKNKCKHTVTHMHIGTTYNIIYTCMHTQDNRPKRTERVYRYN